MDLPFFFKNESGLSFFIETFIKLPTKLAFLEKPLYKWNVLTQYTPVLSTGCKNDSFWIIIIFF